MRHAKRLLGFALLPALSMLASLVLLPLISQRFGSSGWVALGLGQSIGALVSVIVGMAWPIIGGDAVARADGLPARRSLYRSSTYSRLVLLAVMLLMACPLTAIAADGYRLTTTLFMVGISLNGLTAAWYFAGVGEPRHLVVNEGVTRLAGYALALGGMLIGAPLIWYAAATVLSGGTAVALNWFTIMGMSAFRSPGGWTTAVQVIREQFRGTVSRLLQAAFTFGGPSIFAVVAPMQLPIFTAIDQVQKAGNNTLNFLPQAFIQWVGLAENHQRRSRMTRCVYLMAIACASLIPVWLLVGPVAFRFLFAGQVRLPLWGHLLLILAIAAILFNASIELLLLIPLGFSRVVYLGNSVASLLGIALVGLGALLYGPFGAVAAWISVHVLLLVYYLNQLARRHTVRREA
ncbi:MAG TPA: hypothetical protein VEQ66_11620 [Propionibacteriaceae bacterium]|nr:hypothetical protein [Propionibacteriaceae bacterium]